MLDVPCFLINGISKLLGLPQLKLSWIAAFGPVPALHEVRHRLEIVADTYLSVGSAVQLALPQLMRDAIPVREAIRNRVRTNYASLVAKLKAGTGATVLRAEGGWSAVVQLPRTMDDEAWCLRLLTEQNVLVHPGHYFDLARGSCIVLSLLTESGLFLEGLDRIEAAVTMGGQSSGSAEE